MRVLYFHNDVNGAPEELTDQQGEIVWNVSYQAWGNTFRETCQPSEITRQNIRFQGQYLDRETGLHYNTFRYYDPDVGRFTTTDPISLFGGLNLYQYAPNPLMWIDPWGWCPKTNSRAKPTSFHKRTVGAVSKLRAAFDKKGGAKEKYLKWLAKQPGTLQKYGAAAVAKMKNGKVPDNMVVHHKKPLFRGGTNAKKNLDLIDDAFHRDNNKDLHWYPEGQNPYGLN